MKTELLLKCGCNSWKQLNLSCKSYFMTATTEFILSARFYDLIRLDLTLQTAVKVIWQHLAFMVEELPRCPSGYYFAHKWAPE